ncbi:DNA-binding protein [Acinetobacter sp. B10A]|uniref:hypothetical protein n=1 Tax=Acinetobacter baretiae TaxID=2605383 RepID=UPI001B3C539D|nr:hypothetical protein [Acinetobacter baretiae]MBF7686451.1 DNA-binding protein [Acinetobacter baretiae]
MTPSEFSKAVHDALFKLGKTQKQWALENGFAVQYTSLVVSGRSVAVRGKAREIKLRLEDLIASTAEK